MPQSVVPVGLAYDLCPRKQFYIKLFVYNTVVLAGCGKTSPLGKKAREIQRIRGCRPQTGQTLLSAKVKWRKLSRYRDETGSGILAFAIRNAADGAA
jgi:hypothetical protein